MQVENKFKGFKPQPYKIPNISHIQRQQQEAMDRINKSLQAEREKKERYDQEILETLKSIESNTVGLNEVVPLIASSVDNQVELLEFLKEALSISASENQKEADSKWRKLMGKANTLTKDVETIQKIHGFVNTVYQLYINTQL